LVPIGFMLGLKRDHLVFLVIPALIYLAAAVSSSMNFGIRHLLPFYPFLIVLIAAAGWNLATRRRSLAVMIGLLFVAHAASSLRAYPNYLPYANEFWGGPGNAHNVKSDSNLDWGQGLIALKRYTDEHHIKTCWFAYFADLVSDSSYYGIPCKPLPTAFGSLVRLPTPVIPPQLDGPVFLSASEVSSSYWNGDWANPYVRFQKSPPSAVVADSILVFAGRVDLHEAAALIHAGAAMDALNGGFFDRALGEADAAVSLSPESPYSHSARATVLAATQRQAEAVREMAAARGLATQSESAR